MKELFLVGAAAIAGIAFYVQSPFSDPNVYNLPPAETYRQLRAVKVEPSGTGPFGRLKTTTSGVPDKSVTWTATGSHARHSCTTSIEATPDNKSRLNVSCNGGGPSDGAAAGMVSAMVRKSAIELVDSTLDKRDYSPQRAKGSTASGWPAEPSPTTN